MVIDFLNHIRFRSMFNVNTAYFLLKLLVTQGYDIVTNIFSIFLFAGSGAGKTLNPLQQIYNDDNIIIKWHI